MGCDCPDFPNCGTVEVVVGCMGVVDIVPVAGVDGLVNPNENLGALSAGLGGSVDEVVFVVIALGGLKAEIGFTVFGVGAGVSVT